MPPPHVTLQSVHAVHDDTTQSTGHTCALHAFSSVSSGQVVPLNCALVITSRFRCALPPPHDSEHVDHEDHEDVTQSTGHGEVLHTAVSSREGQVSPLNAGWTCTLRARDLKPPPHCALQSDHVPQ